MIVVEAIIIAPLVQVKPALSSLLFTTENFLLASFL